MSNDPSTPSSSRLRTIVQTGGIRVEIRKKRRVTIDPPGAPRHPRPAPAAAAETPTDSHTNSKLPASASQWTPITEFNVVPLEPVRWQAVSFLKKTGVVLVVVPPGACCFALSAFFASHLTARTVGPFGPARYPGTVLYTTHTPHLDRSLRAAQASTFLSEFEILTRHTSRPFNWKKPLLLMEDALGTQKPGAMAAIIIDAGPLPAGVDEAVVASANAALNAAALQADCLILVVVESTSRNIDPFERVPRSLRMLRGPIIAAPLRSKALAPPPGAPAEFLLMRLPEASPYATIVRFTLTPAADGLETPRINWGSVSYADPREAFRRAETNDLSEGQRVAVQIATQVIREKGPTSSSDLQAAGLAMCGIARTTMRDALSVGALFGHLAKVRSYSGQYFWIIPGVTPIPPWVCPPHGSGEDIPF